MVVFKSLGMAVNSLNRTHFVQWINKALFSNKRKNELEKSAMESETWERPTRRKGQAIFLTSGILPAYCVWNVSMGAGRWAEACWREGDLDPWVGATGMGTDSASTSSSLVTGEKPPISEWAWGWDLERGFHPPEGGFVSEVVGIGEEGNVIIIMIEETDWMDINIQSCLIKELVGTRYFTLLDDYRQTVIMQRDRSNSKAAYVEDSVICRELRNF